MKGHTLLGLLIGTLLLWAAYTWTGAGTAAEQPGFEPAPAADASLRLEPAVSRSIAVAAELTASPAASPEPAVSGDRTETAGQAGNDGQAEEAELPLQVVEGISLQDDRQAVIETLGEPPVVQPDPYTEELEIYRYPGLDVGLCMGQVDFVRVLPEAGTIRIDGRSIPMQLDAVLNELGEPDFVAEDGLVFKRGPAAIKLFVSQEEPLLTSVDYFHRTGS